MIRSPREKSKVANPQLEEAGCPTAEATETPMKIKLNSVIVKDQASALRFYTEVLGFVMKMDVPDAPRLPVG
jgi:hypothetical protein